MPLPLKSIAQPLSMQAARCGSMIPWPERIANCPVEQWVQVRSWLSHLMRLVAVAREDSEVNEGVIDLWAADQGQLVQKLYHPWQISALHFAEKQLIVALTDGTIQVWELGTSVGSEKVWRRSN